MSHKSEDFKISAVKYYLDVDMTDLYNEKRFSLKQLLYKYLKEDKKKIIEMQQYIPHNYIHNNFN